MILHLVFLVSANIFIGLFKINNYNKLNIIFILISRLNAKIKSMNVKRILLLKKILIMKMYVIISY